MTCSTVCDCCKGACCCGPTCTQSTCKACEAAGGVFMGATTPCTPDPCTKISTGACCNGTTCSITSECQCKAASGTYKGNSTTCSPVNPCVASTRALCTLTLSIRYGPYSLCGCPAGMSLSGTPGAPVSPGYYPPGCPAAQSWNCVKTMCADTCSYTGKGTDCSSYATYNGLAYSVTYPYASGAPYGTVYCPCVGTYAYTCDAAGCVGGLSLSPVQEALQAAYVPTSGDLAALTMTEAAPDHGPGTELKLMLGMIGIVATPGCSCNARADYMNVKGSDWCEQNIDEVVAWLREEANSRGLPFFQYGARKIVQRAIRMARKKESKKNV